MKRTWISSVVLGATLLMASAAHGIDGPEVIERLQKQFEKTRTITARFERSYYWKLVDQTQTLEGRLYVQKPNRFRFETKMRTVVTDGDRAWNFDRTNEQVLVSAYDVVDQDNSYEKLLFDLILLGDYTSRFDPAYAGEERVDGQRCHVVILKAKDEGAYNHTVRLWADRKDWIVRKVEYTTINDDITTYVLSDLKENKDPEEGTFVFNPPQGVEVIDLR